MIRTLALINKDKADLFNFYFSRIGKNLASALPDPEISQVNDQGSVCVREIPTILEVNITQHNVRREIKELKTNKSTGPDNISPKLLRLAGNDIAPSLTELYHVSLNNGIVFSSWKIARLTPIFKKDEESDVENYRPVSILSVRSKMLESQVNSAIVDHVFEKNELVSDRQLAYRKGLSTERMLIRLTENWRNLIDSNMKIAVAFIDLKKAFDSVSHTILERKLECDFGLSGSLLPWVSSHLRGRRQYTAVNDSLSDMLPVTLGIPQGSVLGPTLFVLFTNDLLSSIDNGEIYMYADDTTVFAVGVLSDEAIAKLNTALKELYK